MASLHRLQWIDAQIRAGRYPNTRGLAKAFEISRRQALRDFEYLRDSLGAPVEYSAQHRGYYYTADTYTLPGPYVSGAQRAVLEHLAASYARAASGSGAENPIYAEMADLFLRLGRRSAFEKPPARMTRHVTPPLLPSEWVSPKRRNAEMTTDRNPTQARFTPGWTSYIGAVRGVLSAAGLSDLDYTRLMGMPGIAFHLIVHDNCDVSSATVYPWMEEHQAALDRIGVLSEVHMTLPGSSGVGDMGQGSPPVPYANLGRTFPNAPILHYQIPVERVAFDQDKAYRASLAAYAEQMEREFHVAPPYKCGLRAYQTWERALAAGQYDAFGLRYLTSVYADAKEQAAALLPLVQQAHAIDREALALVKQALAAAV